MHAVVIATSVFSSEREKVVRRLLLNVDLCFQYQCTCTSASKVIACSAKARPRKHWRHDSMPKKALLRT